MIRVLLSFLQKNSGENTLTKEQFDGAAKALDMYDAVLPKLILIFFSFFALNLFLFSSMASVVLIIFAFVSHFGDLNQISDNKDLPENMSLFLGLAGVATAVLSYGFFKLMKKIWSKVSLVKKEELKLEL